MSANALKKLSWLQLSLPLTISCLAATAANAQEWVEDNEVSIELEPTTDENSVDEEPEASITPPAPSAIEPEVEIAFSPSLEPASTGEILSDENEDLGSLGFEDSPNRQEAEAHTQGWVEVEAPPPAPSAIEPEVELAFSPASAPISTEEADSDNSGGVEELGVVAQPNLQEPRSTHEARVRAILQGEILPEDSAEQPEIATVVPIENNHEWLPSDITAEEQHSLSNSEQGEPETSGFETQPNLQDTCQIIDEEISLTPCLELPSIEAQVQFAQVTPVDPSIFTDPELPEDLPEPTETPEVQLEFPEIPEPSDPPLPEGIPSTIRVQQFQVEPYPIADSQDLVVFSTEELLNTLEIDVLGPDIEQSTPEDATTQSLAAFNNSVENRVSTATIPIQQVLQLPAQVAALYAALGYSTSGAVVSIDEKNALVKVQVIEGQVEAIVVERVLANGEPDPDQISEPSTDTAANASTDNNNDQCPARRPLSCNYIRARLGAKESTPLNVNALQESLQLLQLDPMIDRISATLSEGASPGSSRLLVQFRESPPLNAQVRFSNGRSPSIGSFQRQLDTSAANLLGVGDVLTLAYSNTDGSNGVDVGYTIPLNPANGTLSLNFNASGSRVIEPPFDEVDIESNSQSYEVQLRQPLIRRIRGETFEELAVGLSGTHRKSQSSLLGVPFPLSAGSDAQGRTTISAIRFFQEWTQQNNQQVLALRSQFNLGIDALGATVNNTVPGADPIPDSRFFSWQGQAQWIRRLGRNSNTFLTARANAQLAGEGLLSAEQFSLGGFGSVRGYRQDSLQTDNGILASVELRRPVLSAPKIGGSLSLIPFFDIGTGWNVAGDQGTENTLASLGLGAQWQQENLSVRLDYGVPLTTVGNSRNRTWQENGFLFSVQYGF